MTSSNGNIFRVTGPLSGEPRHRWIPLTKASDEALIFSLIWCWTNGLANNRDPGDLRSHRTHYDVTLMGVIRYRSISFKVISLAIRQSLRDPEQYKQMPDMKPLTSTDWKQSQEIKVVGRYFCGKLSLYFAKLYEVLKGTKPPNHGAP